MGHPTLKIVKKIKQYCCLNDVSCHAFSLQCHPPFYSDGCQNCLALRLSCSQTCFLYQIFPANKQLSQNYAGCYITRHHLVSLSQSCQLTGYLPRENSSSICSKFSGKMSHQRWSHFWEKREDCTSWLFFSRRREFNIWDLLVCWQPQWESQQGVVPLFRERKNRERKRKTNLRVRKWF